MALEKETPAERGEQVVHAEFTTKDEERVIVDAKEMSMGHHHTHRQLAELLATFGSIGPMSDGSRAVGLVRLRSDQLTVWQEGDQSRTYSFKEIDNSIHVMSTTKNAPDGSTGIWDPETPITIGRIILTPIQGGTLERQSSDTADSSLAHELYALYEIARAYDGVPLSGRMRRGLGKLAEQWGVSRRPTPSK